MPPPSLLEKRTVHPPEDRGLRLALVVVTVLVFAGVFGWLACLQRMDGGEVEFHWQWRAGLWITIGIASPVYFWRQIWPVTAVPPAGATRRAITGWAALLLPSLMWMAYPLRFISGQQLLNVCIGLSIAATVLAFGGWMVFRLIQGFANEETPPSGADSNCGPETASPARKPGAPTPPVV